MRSRPPTPSTRRRLLSSAIAVMAVLALSTACSQDPADPGPTGVQRIVSLSPVHTEMLFAIGAGAQVVAVDDQSNYPADAPKTALSGFTPNVEAIAEYTPDLVVLSYDPSDIVNQLTALGIEVYIETGANSVEDIYTQLTELGALTGHADEAAALIETMRDELAKLVQDLPQRPKPLTYFFEVSDDFYTTTSDSFVGELFTAAGLVNIADEGNAGNPFPQLSEERILAANPDLIFLADAYPGGPTPQTVAARPGWADLTAVREGRIVVLDTDVASRWGPRIVDLQRAIVDAVAAVPVS